MSSPFSIDGAYRDPSESVVIDGERWDILGGEAPDVFDMCHCPRCIGPAVWVLQRDSGDSIDRLYLCHEHKEVAEKGGLR